MLPLSVFIHACPAVRLGSPPCSPALVRACPAIRLGSPRSCPPTLLHACPAVCLGSPCSCSPALVRLSRHSFGQAPFVLTGPCLCSPLLVHARLHSFAGPRSCLAFARARWCSFGFVRASFVLVRLSFVLVRAWLCSFVPVWAHRLCLHGCAGSRLFVCSFVLVPVTWSRRLAFVRARSCSFVCITYTVSTHIIIEKLTFCNMNYQPR
jgi:hypothetical protein